MSTYQVRSLEEADLIVKQHEEKTKTSYALLRSTKNFGCVDVPGCNNEEQEVRFDTVGVPYCGVPFFVAGLKILQCQSYKEKGSKTMSKKKEIKIELPGSCASVINSPLDQMMPAELTNRTMPPRKKKKKVAGGRAPRSSCTATVILKEVIYYPEFQLLEHSRNNRLGVARQLKEVLRNRSPIQKDRIIYVTVPSHSDHFGHPVGQIVSKKIYLKNDYYGPVQNTAPTQSSHISGDSPAKRLYFPVKEEKGAEVGTDFILGLPMSCFEESIKRSSPALEGGDSTVEAKAKEVRDLLQSVMAFTYKCTDSDTVERLRLDLVSLKQRYLERPKQGEKRPASTRQQHALPDSGKREQQAVQLPQQPLQQQQAVTVQPQPQIVLLKQSKPQQQQIIQQQIVPRVVPGPRPIRLKGQQQQQQPILQVQQMDNDPSTLSITINPVGAVASSSSLASLSGAALTALPSATSTVAGLSSGPLCTPSFTNIAGNTLHAMPIASLPTVSIAGNASSLPITTLPSFPTVVVPSAALQPSNVTLAIPAGSFSALSGALPAFSNGSSFPARSIASAASISLGSISTLQTGVLPSLQCSATSLPSIVAPVLSDIIMAPAAQTPGVSVSAVTNSPSFSSFTSGSQTATAQRVLTSISTNKSFVANNNRNVNDSNTYSVNVSQNNVASSVSTTPLCSLPAGTIISNLGVACIAQPANKSSSSPSHLTSIGSPNVAVCTSVDGSTFSSNASGVTCTWTVAAPLSLHVSSTCLSGVSSACDVTSARSSTSKPPCTSSQRKSSLMQDSTPPVLRDAYDPHHQQHHNRQLRSGLTSDEQRTDLIQSTAAAPVPSVSLVSSVSADAASDLKASKSVATTVAGPAPSDSGNNQETSIFIEAMEAILNSHM